MGIRNNMIIAALTCLGAATAAEPFAWQQPQAGVDPRGDLSWAPRGVPFEAGVSTRYIDYVGGDDAADGSTPAAAWKHHPWDEQATGAAAAASGVHTYVFKGGVAYRGFLAADESGTADEPIRLTSDPEWGDGPGLILGSERVTGWTRGSKHPNIPDAAKAWTVDVPFKTRALWLVEPDGSARRIPIARHPNWTPEPEDAKADWWEWDNPGKPFGHTMGKRHLGIDTVNVPQHPKAFFEDAVIWPEFGWVMGGPYPTKVEGVDTERGGLSFAGWTGGTAGVIFRHQRYYLEAKPHYLDDPQGEFWFEQVGDGERLHLRLPDGLDPNQVRIEAGVRGNMIRGRELQHIEITRLTFRFNNERHDYWNVPLDWSTKPPKSRPDNDTACVSFAESMAIRVANCRFLHVMSGIRLGAGAAAIDRLVVSDNLIEHCDAMAIAASGGAGWGLARREGELRDVAILRNRVYDAGMRPQRFAQGTAIEVAGVRTGHIAGNQVERSGAQGINVVGGKSSDMWGDHPLTRVLIHHNKVWKTMQWCNDYGGIEAWQSGSFYIYNNLSHDARGMWYGRNKAEGSSTGFGHAYYLDGAYKSFLFNNIAWGLSNDTTGLLVNCSAFQEIHGFLNTYANNSAWNFAVGSRRQAPEPGLNKYLGNVFSDISVRALRHTDPAKADAEANADHVGKVGHHFDIASNAYAGNVFHDVAQLGTFEPGGAWRETVDDFRAALATHGPMASELGVATGESPFRDPAAGDFRPSSSAAGRDRGAKVFVPWAIGGVCAEWHFTPPAADPTRVVDEHWYQRDFYTGRKGYESMPRYDLRVDGVTAADYVAGELEDWTTGALRFDPAAKRYAVVTNDALMAPITVKGLDQARLAGGKVQDFEIAPERLANAQIRDGALLIEAYATVEPGAEGILIAKRDATGYAATVAAGKLVFSAGAASVTSAAVIADGAWHHLVCELDREADRLRIYVDGRLDAEAAGPGNASLENGADLVVGGSPAGDHLAVTIDFLRIARATLAASDTSIEELHAWQFDGPFLRDFTGRKPVGKRDAGAIEGE